jgi:hypothetical protein
MQVNAPEQINMQLKTMLEIVQERRRNINTVPSFDYQGALKYLESLVQDVCFFIEMSRERLEQYPEILAGVLMKVIGMVTSPFPVDQMDPASDLDLRLNFVEPLQLNQKFCTNF